MIKHKKTVLILLIWILLIAAYICVLNNKGYYLRMQVSGISEEEAALSIFYDNGLEDYPFDENHMFFEAMEIKNESQTIEVIIPQNGINNLRFDFGNAPGTFYVENLEVRTFWKSADIKPQDCIDHIWEQGDIEKININKEDDLELVVNGNDGYICLENILAGVSMQSNDAILSVILGIGIVYLLYLLGLRFFEKRKVFIPIYKNLLLFSLVLFILVLLLMPQCEVIRSSLMADMASRILFVFTTGIMIYFSYLVGSVSERKS